MWEDTENKTWQAPGTSRVCIINPLARLYYFYTLIQITIIIQLGGLS